MSLSGHLCDVILTQGLDIEEVGNETINHLVKHNSRQLRYFETILTACAEELGLCSDVANPLLCDLSGIKLRDMPCGY